jgi:hypothetical protein
LIAESHAGGGWKKRILPSMPPKNETPRRGRGKRPRESSREEGSSQAFAPVSHYGSQSSTAQPGPDFNRHAPPSSPASKTFNTSTSTEVRSAQPINVITSHPPPGKVAIPALRQPQSFDSSGKGSKKGRTSHACDYCRKSKAGCSGEQPCIRCRNTRVACVYGDGKREHDRK